MGKISAKTVVYLDQNFLSEIAKRKDPRKQIRPEFQRIFELLQKGFQEEKLVVPKSWFHKVETSLAVRLKDTIKQHQGFLGQVDLQYPEHVYIFQLGKAAKKFLGGEDQPLSRRDVFVDDPDNRVQRFDIEIDMHLENWHSSEDRQRTAEQLEQARKAVENEELTFSAQLERELRAYGDSFLRFNSYGQRYLFHNVFEKIQEFAYSKEFKGIPRVDISCRMWAAILAHYRGRRIQSGDATDIDIISTYMPYVDILAVDAFMANLIKTLGLDKKYGTYVFNASTSGLKEFIQFLEEHIANMTPVNKPQASVFVWADKRIKEDSWEFFRKLGIQANLPLRGRKWVALYAFDDGEMPHYILKKGPKLPMPFYGLQEVDPIKIDSDVSQERILELCREHCKSEKFLVIDSYRNLPENFVCSLLKYCEDGKGQILGYKIYSI